MKKLLLLLSVPIIFAASLFAQTVITEDVIYNGFSGGQSAQNGGAIYNVGTLYFNNNISSFTNNSTGHYGNGGAIFNRGTINFNGDTYFYNNYSRNSGGAFALDYGSSLTFNGNTHIFESNHAAYGAAIHIFGNGQNTVNFSSANVFFLKNTSSSGGIISATKYNSGKVFFNDGTATFTNNNGTIIVSSGGNVQFNNTIVVFASNTNTVNFSNDFSQLVFNPKRVEFNYNSYNANGLLVNNMQEFLKHDVIAKGNTTNNGGFLYYQNAGVVNFDKTLELISNTARGAGGAIYAENSILNFNNKLTAYGNIAASSGGAIYLKNSTATFNSANGEILFSSNKAADKPNDIYAENSIINFNAVNNDIILASGLITDSDSIINKTGAGTLYFGTNYRDEIFDITSKVNIVQGTLNIQAGSYTQRNSEGIEVKNASIVIGAWDTTFQENISAGDGGALKLYNSQADIGSYTIEFSSNVSAGQGGAIYGDSLSNLKFSTGDMLFLGNIAVRGGALYLEQSLVEMGSYGKIFIANKASEQGGAIYVNNGQKYVFNSLPSIFAGTNFISNTAGTGGGLYLSNNSSVEFNGSWAGGIIFSKNQSNSHGGAVYLSQNSKMLFGSIVYHNDYIISASAEFSSNTATDNGGAIFAQSATLNFLDSNFVGNSAGWFGGAIQATSPNDWTVGANITFGGKAYFLSNSARAGGAIVAEKRSTVNFGEGSYSEFISNKANGSGGSDQNMGGGAIYAANSGVVNFNKNSSVLFASNTATMYGGAMSLRRLATANFNFSKADFVGNSAAYGGAISLYNFNGGNTLNFINSDVNFLNNKASVYGGAIYIGGYPTISNIYFTNSNILFEGNTANLGSAIYIDESNASNKVSFENSVITFSNNNSTGQDGAMIYIKNSNLSGANQPGQVSITGGKVIFSSNTSTINFINDWSRLIFNPEWVEFNNHSYNSNGLKIASRNEFLKQNIAAKGNTTDNGGFLFFQNEGTATFAKNVNLVSNTARGDGGAIYADNTDLLFKGESIFVGNSATYGGAIRAKNGASLEFSNSPVHYSNNSAGNFGGAIYADGASSVDFKNSTIIFDSNNAMGGSAIYVSDSGKINFYYSNVDFRNNISSGASVNAYVPGAAIEIMGKAYVTFNDSSINFDSNLSDFHGGAIKVGYGAYYAKESGGFLDFNNSIVKFIDNKAGVGAYGADGGAIYAGHSIITFNSSDIIFSSNTANVGAYHEGSWQTGGAIMADMLSDFQFNNSNTEFSYNVASASGGALGLRGSTVSFNGGRVEFIGNKALIGSGGAIYSESAHDILSYPQSVYLATYTANTIFNADVVFKENSAANYGGAIYLNQPEVTFNKNASFIDNKVGDPFDSSKYRSGGAIYAASKQAYNFNGEITIFSGNEANIGGAIHADRRAIINFNEGKVVFENNKSHYLYLFESWYSGGAVNLDYSAEMAFNNSEVEFNNNYAEMAGAAIKMGAAAFNSQNAYTEDFSSKLRFHNSTASFTNNSSVYFGAIYANGLIEFISSNILFSGNATGGNGGAIYSRGSNIKADNSSIIFINNKASGTYSSGGAFFMSSSSGNFNNSNIEFYGNEAGRAGALYVGASYGHWNNPQEGLAGSTEYSSFLKFNSSKVLFSQNLALESGASVFVGGSSEVDFKNSEVSFIGNKAMENAGAVYASTNAVISFIESEAEFKNNQSENLGGAIYAEDNSVINFIDSKVSFNNNSAVAGGAFYVDKAAVNFEGNYAEFINNSASSAGGAFLLFAVDDYAKVSFKNGQYLFENNSMISNANAYDGGGVVYLGHNSQMSFDNSSVNFKNNKTDGIGGVFRLGDYHPSSHYVNTSIKFTNSDVMFEGNEAGYAGAIYAFGGTTVAFNSSMVTFQGNKGGVLAGQMGNYIFSESTVNFINNSRDAHIIGASGVNMLFEEGSIKFVNTGTQQANNSFDGGAIYLSPYVYGNWSPISGTTDIVINSTTSFVNTEVLFEGMYAKNGGAIAVIGGTDKLLSESMEIVFENKENSVNMNFQNSKVYFINNKAEEYGGAIYAKAGSQINFIDSDVYFISNTAKLGSAIYAVNGASVNFTGGSLTLQGNVSTGENGAAFYVDATSTVTLQGVAMTMFNNHSAKAGGAVYLGSSASLTFDEDQVFNSNEAGESGGAIAAMENAKLEFNNIETNFTGNTANQGGALYSYLADILFEGGEVNFDNNSAVNGGGAIFAIDDIIFRGINAGFSNNNAGSGKGGAIFSEDTIAKFQNAAMLFYNNRTLSDGGAIYAGDNSSIDLGGQATFEGNIAGGKGGAIYLDGSARRSTMTISADSGDIVFRNNIAGGVPNDIYVDSNSALTLSGTHKIRLEGGLLTSTIAADINITKIGTGVLELGGRNEIWGSFDISAGDLRFINNATFTGKELKLDSGNKLDMANNAVNIISVDTFASTTETSMDIFANNTNDKVYAASATVSGDIKLNFGVGIYNNNVYELFVASNTSDLYTNIISSSSNIGDISFTLDDSEAGKYKLLINGFHKVRFSSLASFNPADLSYNQKEVLNALDEVVVTINPNGELINVANAVLSQGAEQQKALLANASGYLFANVVRGASLDADSINLYDRINNNKKESGIWAQVIGASIKHDADKNSIEEYKDNMVGMMLGYDAQTSEKVKFGIYGKYNGHSIEQGNSGSADVNNIGLGAYVGYEEQAWEIKAMLGGSYDSYETTRNISGLVAKGDFNGVTFGADVEGALKVGISEKVNFRPYVGLEAKNVNYGSFTEKGAGAMNLDVSGDNYMRSAARLGIGLEYTENIWNIYVKGEGKYVMSGTESEVEASFEGTTQKFKSKGYDEEEIEYGASLGGEVKVYKGLNVFVNGSYKGGSKMSNIGGNAGLRYNFK